MEKLYIIGVYGAQGCSPDFIPCLEKWFEGSEGQKRVLGLERHRYGQKMTDYILDVAEVKEQLDVWLTSIGEVKHGKGGEAVNEGA